MASRGRASLKAGRGRGLESARSRSPSAPKQAHAPAQKPGPLVYTAQDVARFCEVDLKTIHHWANAAKIAHHRTEGRHIRIRRNDLVRFLRAHGYPLHDAITSVKPTLLLASGGREELASDDLVKKLATRFHVRRFEHAASAIARLVHDEPDGIVCALEDPSWNAAATIAALKSDPATAWPAMVVITARGVEDAGPDALGADLAISTADIGRLHTELAKHLAVS